MYIANSRLKVVDVQLGSFAYERKDYDEYEHNHCVLRVGGNVR